MSRANPASAAWAEYYSEHPEAIAVWGESNNRDPWYIDDDEVHRCRKCGAVYDGNEHG